MNLKNKTFLIGVFFSFVSLAVLPVYAQQVDLRLANVTIVSYSKTTNLPYFVKFNPDQNIKEEGFISWITLALNLPDNITFKAYDIKKDDLNITHTRYKEYINNFPVEGSMIITHSTDGRLSSVNGDYFLNVNTNTTASITETIALEKALKKVNAITYKWENKKQEAAMRELLKHPDFTYFPKGELVMVHRSGTDYSAANIRLAYKFNIYAEKPLYRSYVFVDAQTAEVIAEKPIIHTADVLGTANTKYSGAVNMTSDNFGTNQYRLRETGRGNGIQTFNLNNSTTYSNTDFTNSSSAWNVTGFDQAAADAHWGAEKTYDYFQTIHNRNSIDGNGFALLSYVHYDVNYVNAFWDGQEMTYGDGNTSQGFKIMTALDICGHEVTHGLVQYTAGLGGSGTDESDALNEGFADIFGTSIEVFARPSQNDWLLGADNMTNNGGLRDMSNPSNLGDPNCYLGTNWDGGGEPHKNAGPSIYWYYLLCMGGSGTNDNGDAFNVSGISMAKAEKIAFRGLSVYFTPGTTYADARTGTIQAAVDLYGGCSPEVIATTNAWHAVGVGPVFSGTVNAAFTALATSSCVLPFVVNFSNTSTNAGNATWYFGDGSTSTLYNPSHSYGTAGTYNVKLKVSSACGSDSVLQTSFITVNPPPAPTATGAYSCTAPSILTLSATGGGTLNWYNAPFAGVSLASGSTFTTPSISNTATYYVESQITGATGSVGPPTTTIFGGGGYHNNTSTQYLTFDVLQACTIQTALVNSGAAGTRNIIVWDTTGVQLQSIPVNFPNGIGTVTLNIHLAPGSYRIGGTGMNLWRNNTGGTYPFTLNSVISITGSSAGPDFYYYIYNWLVQNDPCVSPRIPVVATIGGTAVAYSAAVYDTICSNKPSIILTGGTPTGGVYSGVGVNSGSFDPALAGEGSYTITYSYADTGNCTNIASQTIYVIECVTGINSNDVLSGLALYPNPTDGSFTLQIDLLNDEKVKIELMNSIGQVILLEDHNFVSGNNKLSLNLNGAAKGIYFVQATTLSSVLRQRIVMK